VMVEKTGGLKTLDEEELFNYYVKHKVSACIYIISSRGAALNSELQLNIDLSTRDMNIHRSRATKSLTSVWRLLAARKTRLKIDLKRRLHSSFTRSPYQQSSSRYIDSAAVGGRLRSDSEKLSGSIRA